MNYPILYYRYQLLGITPQHTDSAPACSGNSNCNYIYKSILTIMNWSIIKQSSSIMSYWLWQLIQFGIISYLSWTQRPRCDWSGHLSHIELSQSSCALPKFTPEHPIPLWVASGPVFSERHRFSDIAFVWKTGAQPTQLFFNENMCSMEQSS